MKFPVQQNLIHLAMSSKIMKTFAKFETSCQDHDSKIFLEHLGKILTRSFQCMPESSDTLFTAGLSKPMIAEKQTIKNSHLKFCMSLSSVKMLVQKQNGI